MSSSEIFLVRDDNFGHGLVSAGQWAFTLGDYNFGGDTIYVSFASIYAAKKIDETCSR